MTLTLVSLALTASPAFAGSYSDPSFSGGYWTFDDDPNSYPFPQANPYAGDHEDANFCGGDLTATSTWTPDNSADTSPAPQVIVTQTADAYWDVRGVNGFPTASCADGFGDDEAYTSYMEGYYSADSARTNYSTQSPSGGTVTVTCSGVSATMDYNSTTPPVDDGDVGASWGVTLSPVTITLGGAIQDNSGNWNILVGQHCTASLSGIPSSCAVSNYQWSVSGPTFQDWQAQTPATATTPFDSEASYYVGGFGPPNAPTASWQWAEVGKDSSKPETVTCTATVTPPTGQGAAFTVSATQPVTVWSPAWTCTASGGIVDVDNSYIGGPGFWLNAGPTSSERNFGIGAGTYWNATVATPTSSPILFGTGSLQIAQIVTNIDAGYLTNGASPSLVYDPNNGEVGLDTQWPYGWSTSVKSMSSLSYTSGDSPGINVDGNQNAYYNISCTDYLMYLPPGSGRYVPLAKYTWSANMSATLPSTGNWINFTGTAGTITDSNQTGTFVRSNEFPSWLLISTAVPF